MQKDLVSAALILMLTSAFASAAEERAVISIRGAEHLAETYYCDAEKCSRQDIQTDVQDFANGNTFVRFKDAVAGKNVDIHIPASLSSDQFIELLIKIRTARQEFARSINIVTQKDLPLAVQDGGKTIINATLMQKLLVTAGADELNDLALPAQPVDGHSRKVRTKFSYLVDSGTHPSLARGMATQLSIPLFSLPEAIEYAKTHVNANAIFLSTPVMPHNKSFVEALGGIASLKEYHQIVTFVTPYLPYARSDKKDQPGVSITGRLVADIIEASGADAVQFTRAHAPQSQGFFSIPSIQTAGQETINRYLKSIDTELVISPDTGFQKDATLYATALGVPVAVINKQRDVLTAESKLHDISGPSVAGKNVAIIDDETASGSTLVKAAAFVKKLGALSVTAVVTHLSGNALQAINSADIDRMVVTDTFPITTNSPKLTALPISEEMSNDLKSMLGIIPACSKVYNGR